MSPPEKIVGADEIRRVFAEGRYFQRFQAGEFLGDVWTIGAPLKRPGETLPQDSHEQIVRYHRPGSHRTVAIVHQRAGDAYGNPAPNTWADPKYVFHNGVRYKFSPGAPEPAAGETATSA